MVKLLVKKIAAKSRTRILQQKLAVERTN